jgi:DNA-binding NarL/FixJ family response regulator
LTTVIVVAAALFQWTAAAMAIFVLRVTGRQPAWLRRTSHSRASALSQRESQVLQYVARGLSKKELATTMSLSERTVNCHTASLMAKLDIHDRVEPARYALREGLVEP